MNAFHILENVLIAAAEKQHRETTQPLTETLWSEQGQPRSLGRRNVRNVARNTVESRAQVYEHTALRSALLSLARTYMGTASLPLTPV